MRSIIAIFTAVGALLSAASYSQQSRAGETAGETGFSPYVDAQGNISRPEDFRTNWVHLGSWFVSDDDEASGPGVHDVYAQPEAVAGFKKNGQWPDGAVLVKAISAIQADKLPTAMRIGPVISASGL